MWIGLKKYYEQLNIRYSNAKDSDMFPPHIELISIMILFSERAKDEHLLISEIYWLSQFGCKESTTCTISINISFGHEEPS